MRNFAPGIEEVRRFPEPIPWTETSGDFFFIGGGLSVLIPLTYL